MKKFCIVFRNAWFQVLRVKYLEASRMHEMAARKGSDSCTGGEKEITADRAVSLKALLSALVLFQLHAKAAIACHAMEEVNSQSPPQPAQVAERTVVYHPGK
jgi:hypothetical protein